MVTDPLDDGSGGSRRRLLGTAGAGLAGVGAVLLAGCGSKSLHARLKRTPTVARTDVEVLNHLLEVEQVAIAAYTAGAPLLPPPAARAAKRFLEQETEHAFGLAGLVKAAGGTPRDPLPSYDLGHPRTGDDVLRLLHETEGAQLAAYVDAIPRLRPGAVRAQAAGYFANDAQHVAILRSLLGQTPSPAAFVTGRE